MHPAYDGLAALPFFDEFDLSTVDILLISQYVNLFPFYLLSFSAVGVWLGFMRRHLRHYAVSTLR